MRCVPDIPAKYDHFPVGYINDVRGWAFDAGTIANNVGKLLTLDLDFGDKCSLNCPFCFRRSNSVDADKHALQFADLVRLIDDAKKLGLRTVKFLGAGEPLENEGFLDFLEFLKDRDIVSVVFSKTGLIGDDARVAQMFSDRGIKTGDALADFLLKCGVSVVQGFNSFDEDVQCSMMGCGNGVVQRRNRTLEVLYSTGFADCVPTRLAIGVNPVTRLNVGEALEIYEWARLRNIYAIVTPTMISGREKGDAWRTITPSEDDLVALYAAIYAFNIRTGLTTPEQLLREGVSAYAGGHPCNQVAAGLYVTLNGVVLSCPGCEAKVEGNIWLQPIGDIWRQSRNFTRSGTFNCGCVAKDGKSIPASLYENVLNRLGLGGDRRT